MPVIPHQGTAIIIEQISSDTDTNRGEKETHRENLQEILDLTVLGVDPGYDAFKVRKTLGDLDELLLEGEVSHQVLDSVQAIVTRSAKLIAINRENGQPSIDVLDFSQGHA